MIGAMICALPFAACEKDPVEPTPVTPTPVTPTTQKHNVELVYGDSFQNISMDTLYKYNADPTVDTIFMVLERETVFSGLSLNTTLKLCDSLEVRHNINQNKIFGKGTMNLSQTSVNERVRDVLENKLKYKIREI